MYYAKHLPEVKAIVESFAGSGVLVTQAKVSLQKSGLAGLLLKMKCLVKLMEKMVRSITLKKQCKQSKNLTLVKTLCNINQHIRKRMQNNDISEIINIERQDISPAVNHMLQNSQPTYVSVERNFPMLKKPLAKGRNFRAKNVRHYTTLHFSASTW